MSGAGKGIEYNTDINNQEILADESVDNLSYKWQLSPSGKKYGKKRFKCFTIHN